MKKYLFFILSWCIIFTMEAGALSKSHDSTAGIMKQKIAAFKENLGQHKIKRLEILYFPVEILTRTHITPEMLERQYYYKLIITDIEVSKKANKLCKALVETNFVQTDRKPDVRWGCIFYGENGTRLLSVFLDRSGKKGVVDGVLVSLDSTLFLDSTLLSALKNNFLDCFH